MLSVTSFSASKNVSTTPQPHGIPGMLCPSWLTQNTSPAVAAQGALVICSG